MCRILVSFKDGLTNSHTKREGWLGNHLIDKTRLYDLARKLTKYGLNPFTFIPEIRPRNTQQGNCIIRALRLASGLPELTVFQGRQQKPVFGQYYVTYFDVWLHFLLGLLVRDLKVRAAG